jgi:DNA polymerase III sliding clamp (beta) subunit (PCNA family)
MTAFFVADGFTLGVKCRDDVFPQYKSLKIEPEKAIALNATVLSDAIKRVSTMAKKESGQVVLSFRDGALRISTQDGSGEDSIECACDFEFHSAVNWAYLDQAINAMTCDEVMFNLADRLDPIMITPVGAKDCSALVMPMRV